VLCKVKYGKVPVICTVVRYLFAYCWYSFKFDFSLIEYQELFYIGFEGFVSAIIATFCTVIYVKRLNVPKARKDEVVVETATGL
jgi:hypothetical protein